MDGFGGAFGLGLIEWTKRETMVKMAGRRLLPLPRPAASKVGEKRDAIVKEVC